MVSFDILDLTVPHRYGGQRNVLVITNHYSTLRKAYLLKSRHQTADALEQFLNFSKAHGVQVKWLHRDGAKEFYKSAPNLKEVLKRHGLLGCTSTLAADVHLQNGVAEHSNWTIQEGVRTRLVQAKLGLSYWWLALTDTIEVDVYIPLKGLTSEMPYSRFFGTMPSIAHVRSFSCFAYPHLLRDGQDGGAGASGHIPWMTPHQSAYRVLEISTGKIITTPHMI